MVWSVQNFVWKVSSSEATFWAISDEIWLFLFSLSYPAMAFQSELEIFTSHLLFSFVILVFFWWLSFLAFLILNSSVLLFSVDLTLLYNFQRYKLSWWKWRRGKNLIGYFGWVCMYIYVCSGISLELLNRSVWNFHGRLTESWSNL